MMCRHCNVGRASRPRRLCWRCYYLPGVRELYPPTSKFARHGPGVGRLRVQPVLRATDAPPGSPEKIRVLAHRAELGEELWHPHDATFAGPVLHGRAG